MAVCIEENTLQECKEKCQNLMSREILVQQENIKSLEVDEREDSKVRREESVRALIALLTRTGLKLEVIIRRKRAMEESDHLFRIKEQIHPLGFILSQSILVTNGR